MKETKPRPHSEIMFEGAKYTSHTFQKRAAQIYSRQEGGVYGGALCGIRTGKWSRESTKPESALEGRDSTIRTTSRADPHAHRRKGSEGTLRRASHHHSSNEGS